MLCRNVSADPHLHTAEVQRVVDEVVPAGVEVELHLETLHLPPVALPLDRGLRRDQVAVAACADKAPSHGRLAAHDLLTLCTRGDVRCTAAPVSCCSFIRVSMRVHT